MTRSRQLLLLAGLAVTATGISAVLLAGGPELVPASTGGGAVEQYAESETEQAQQLESAADTDSTNVDAAFVDDSSSISAADDPLESAIEEACAQFRAGATVADFADWLVRDAGSSGEEVRDLFRSAVERALTKDCPEVVPSS